MCHPSLRALYKKGTNAGINTQELCRLVHFVTMPAHIQTKSSSDSSFPLILSHILAMNFIHLNEFSGQTDCHLKSAMLEH